MSPTPAARRSSPTCSPAASMATSRRPRRWRAMSPRRQARGARRHRCQAQPVFPDLPTMIEFRHTGPRSWCCGSASPAPSGHAAANHRQAFARSQRGAQVRRGDEIAERGRPWRRWAARPTSSASIWKPSRSGGTRSSRLRACGSDGPRQTARPAHMIHTEDIVIASDGSRPFEGHLARREPAPDWG